MELFRTARVIQNEAREAGEGRKEGKSRHEADRMEQREIRKAEGEMNMKKNRGMRIAVWMMAALMICAGAAAETVPETTMADLSFAKTEIGWPELTASQESVKLTPSEGAGTLHFGSVIGGDMALKAEQSESFGGFTPEARLGGDGLKSLFDASLLKDAGKGALEGFADLDLSQLVKKDALP